MEPMLHFDEDFFTTPFSQIPTLLPPAIKKTPLKGRSSCLAVPVGTVDAMRRLPNPNTPTPSNQKDPPKREVFLLGGPGGI